MALAGTERCAGESSLTLTASSPAAAAAAAALQAPFRESPPGRRAGLHPSFARCGPLPGCRAQAATAARLQWATPSGQSRAQRVGSPGATSCPPPPPIACSR